LYPESTLIHGIYAVPPYSNSDKPFSFLTPEAVERERNASNLIGSSFEDKGFFRPYSVEGTITYPTIMWGEEPCSTLVLSLPSIESDLRFGEVYRRAFLRLKFASPKQLKDIEDDLGDFLLKLTTWHGFVTKAMEENHLAPTEPSHQNQNYVICHVSDTEIGASRVDHTSTRVNQDQARAYAGMMKAEIPFFSELHISLLHALVLAEQKYDLGEDRYTGYWDRACKWHEPIDLSEVPKMGDYFKELKTAFEKGYQGEPIPIPEQVLVNIMGALSQIEIDEEKQRRVAATLEAGRRAPFGRLLQDL